MLIVDRLKLENFRFERKFFITDCSHSVVESIVKHHPAMFQEVYRPRYNNSIYLDTPGLTSYNDNLLGLSERLKTRVRWYGELFGSIGSAVLELKYKKALTGTKMKYELAPFDLTDSYSYDYQQEVFARSDLPGVIQEYLRTLQPSILIRYHRKYYESADHRFRITLDTDMEFYRLRPRGNSFLDRHIDRNSTVMELKCNEEHGDTIDEITRRIPFRMTKSSKYVSGIDRLYG